MFNYADKIKEYRRRKLLKQTDLSKLLGVSIACITRWENAKFEPTIEVKKKLHQLFIDAGMEIEE